MEVLLTGSAPNLSPDNMYLGKQKVIAQSKGVSLLSTSKTWIESLASSSALAQALPLQAFGIPRRQEHSLCFSNKSVTSFKQEVVCIYNFTLGTRSLILLLTFHSLLISGVPNFNFSLSHVLDLLAFFLKVFFICPSTPY